MVFREDLSDVQQVALAFVPIPMGLLSLAASFAIILVVCRSRRSSSYRRILIGLSVSDILVTSAVLTGPLLVPHESSIILPFNESKNVATCNFSGVLSQTATISNSLYSGFLAVYFLCTVRLGWSPSRFARVLEPYVHVIIVAFVMVMGPISLHQNVFEKSRVAPTCWIASDEHLHLHILFNAMVSLACATIFACNLLIYLHVRSLTRLSLQRSMNPSVATNRKQLVATQSFGYVSAFALTWMPGFIMGIHELSGGVLFRSTATFLVFESLFLLSMPLTGVLNLMVFLRPRYLQFRRQHPHASKWHCARLSLNKAFQETRRQPMKLQACDQIRVENNPVAANKSSEQEEVTATNSTDPTDRGANVV